MKNHTQETIDTYDREMSDIIDGLKLIAHQLKKQREALKKRKGSPYPSQRKIKELNNAWADPKPWESW